LASSIKRRNLRGKFIMGPFSEEKQFQRAKAIERLIKNNPDLDELTLNMWKTKLKNLALDEERYNARVRSIFENMKKHPLVKWN